MEFHQLRYFVAAAETGSMSRAAERVHVSQPALSRQIAQLERHLGAPLFDRVRRRIQLNDAGRFLLPRARQILCDAEASVQLLRERFGSARPTLRIGFVTPFLDDLVAPTVRELRERDRALQVSLFDLPPRAQLERLLGGELDAGILSNLEPEHRRTLQVHVLSRHRFAVALPSGHGLAKARTVALAALRSEPFVSLDDAFFPGRRRFLFDACAAAGFEPDIVHEADSVAMMVGAVVAGDGIALVPEHAARLPHEGCVFVPIRPPAPFVELLLVTRRGAHDGPQAELLRLLRARALQRADA